jgi:DNA-binding transcriptional LysR family regulator
MPVRTSVSDLSNFDLLASVAELGGIGAAARAHGISQPAASQRLRALERQVGVALLVRQARGTRLTPAGEVVLGWAVPVLAAARDLAVGLASLRTDHDSHLRIAASLTVAEYLLPRWLITVRRQHPDVVPNLRTGNSTEVAALVLAGEADLGFVEGPDSPRGLRSREVGKDQLVVIVTPSHPWARCGVVEPDELGSTGLVTREPGSGTRLAFERALARQTGVNPVAPLLEVSSTTAIKAAAAGGVGPAVLSSLAVAPELSAGTLNAVTVPGLDLRRSLRAVWPTGQRLQGPASDLLAIAVASQ